MTKHLLVPAVPAVVALCWLVSLRRTPFAVAWFFLAAVNAAGGVAAALAALQSQWVSSAGALGIACGAVVPAAIAACGTEITAQDSPNASIGKWRQHHPPRGFAKTFGRKSAAEQAKAENRWVVRATTRYDESGRSSANSEKVSVVIERGERRRTIGWADPISEPEEFAALMVRAEDAAATYNHQKIR